MTGPKSEYGELLDKTTLRIERVLPGPIERVWAYLVEPEKRAKWLAAGPMELKAGGRIHFKFDHSNLSDESPPEKYKDMCGEISFESQVLQIEPPRLLKFTWPDTTGELSEVEFRLAPRGDEILLQITHAKLVKRTDLISTSAGWHTHLDVLVAVLTGKQHTTFWSGLIGLETEYEKRFPQS
jgi:uncharacterized protein YndB with AHSA1/START domain